MKQQDSNFRIFLLIVIVSMISVLSIFFKTYFYIQDEITITKQELSGLSKINYMQNIVYDMQKLRGLSNMLNKDAQCLTNIKLTKAAIFKNLEIVKNKLTFNNKSSKDKKKFEEYIKNISEQLRHKIIFEQLTDLIHESILITKRIAYQSKLVLDSHIEADILVEIITTILPEFIESNGQIRGISSAMYGKLNKDSVYKITTQISNIDKQMQRLNFTVNKLCDINNSTYNKFQLKYKEIALSQDMLNSFTKNNILDCKKVSVDVNKIFELNSNNIKLIFDLYTSTSSELTLFLNQQISNNKDLKLYVTIVTLIFIIFILLLNLNFYKKNNKFIEEIRLLSVTDSMTKLHNRRYFDSEFIKQQKIQRRLKRTLVFIMMDIDYFKQYNDIYGHQVGDTALIAVAKSLKDSLNRPDDFAFRLGGEEFGVLCNDMDNQTAIKFANRLRENIYNLKIEHSGNSANKFLTISMGVIVIDPTSTENINNIYAHADRALYDAKQNGRNQVAIFS